MDDRSKREESANVKKLCKFKPRKRKVRATKYQGLVDNSEEPKRKNR